MRHTNWFRRKHNSTVGDAHAKFIYALGTGQSIGLAKWMFDIIINTTPTCHLFLFKILKLVVSGIASLPDLEQLSLGECKQLNEIISTSPECDDDNEEVTDHHAVNIISLSKLRKVRLQWLPKLRSIPLVADSSQGIILGS
ncbi:hypothetical protein PanWU01x14_079670 [Parasponia andersonii]|uniref:LRR domain containing protein n=1 Tax=Parasponia andersonii TaxID=3476 RepID=A0A2P5DBC8_PARAD|nr:hypothetical protein PanWU01x14_079670 [Parasponia andersonii]